MLQISLSLQDSLLRLLIPLALVVHFVSLFTWVVHCSADREKNPVNKHWNAAPQVEWRVTHNFMGLRERHNLKVRSGIVFIQRPQSAYALKKQLKRLSKEK